MEILSPRGVVVGIIPSTNPTSTTIYKALISIKSRNALVLSPHHSAIGCTNETARVLREAAVEEGLPEDAIGCITTTTRDSTEVLMRHEKMAVVLATGGTGLVRAAYASGKPAFGVGPGNVPVFVERTADVEKAVHDILAGKCFDNGTICSSEQSVVVDTPIAGAVREQLQRQGGHFLSASEASRLSMVVAASRGKQLNPAIVGKSAGTIARMARIRIPPGTRCLIAELGGVGPNFPLSKEKLSPILAFYVEDGTERAAARCLAVLAYGGMGHTAGIHTRSRKVAVAFGETMPVSRTTINTPTTHGAIGLSTALAPSLTLGCGSWGGNVTSDNISPLHLMNIKRVAFEVKPVEKACLNLAPKGEEALVINPQAKEGGRADENGTGSEHDYGGDAEMKVSDDGFRRAPAGPRLVAVLLLAMAFAAVLAAGLASPAQAADFTVTKTEDTNDGACDSDCSLREAIKATNDAPGADMVTVPDGTYTLTLGPNDGNQAFPDITRGDLDITDDLSIQGASQSGTIVQAGTSAYSGIDRIFEAWNTGTNATISDMTVQNGNSQGGFFVDLGGAVRNNSADLSLKRIKVSDSLAPCTGGGVFNWRNGTLKLEDSTVSGNRTSLSDICGNHGGGITNEGFTMTITGSTIKNNSSISGGGVDNFATLILENSTLSGNSASSEGGGLRTAAGTSSLTNVTLADNSAPTGGGVSTRSEGATTAKGTIIAGNSPSNCTGSLASSGHNMEDANTCGLDSDPANPDADGDWVDTNPNLGPLADNGGPTETRALLDDSPAIDEGGAPFLPTDQRGISRPQDGDGDGIVVQDIGAFEKEAALPPPPPPSTPTSKEQCKKDGWKDFKDENGNPLFKNQGDCVSFVATKGRTNPARTSKKK